MQINSINLIDNFRKLELLKKSYCQKRGVIHIKISSLQGKKVATKIIYVVEHILMKMCNRKHTKSLTYNFTLQPPDPPLFELFWYIELVCSKKKIHSFDQIKYIHVYNVFKIFFNIYTSILFSVNVNAYIPFYRVIYFWQFCKPLFYHTHLELCVVNIWNNRLTWCTRIHLITIARLRMLSMDLLVNLYSSQFLKVNEGTCQ